MGHLKIINFPFGTNGKLIVLCVPIFKLFRVVGKIFFAQGMVTSDSHSLYGHTVMGNIKLCHSCFGIFFSVSDKNLNRSAMVEPTERTPLVVNTNISTNSVSHGEHPTTPASPGLGEFSFKKTTKRDKIFLVSMSFVNFCASACFSLLAPFFPKEVCVFQELYRMINYLSVFFFECFLPFWCFISFNPVALRKAKIVCNFGLSECNRVKLMYCLLIFILLLSSYAWLITQEKHEKVCHLVLRL